MPTITFHEGLGQYGQVITQIDFANLSLNGFGNTATLTDPNGMKIVMLGDGMGYSAGETSWYIATGTVHTLQVLDASDTVLFEVTGTAADGAWLHSQISAGHDLNMDIEGGPGRLWGTDNIVFGSRAEEALVTGTGDDSISGGYGDDRIASLGGDDTFTGGRGADLFSAVSSGSITITDFNDSGPLTQQDDLYMSRKQYRDLEVTQVGNDTHLFSDKWGGGGPGVDLTLKDFDMTNLDRTDFTFQL